MTRAGAPRPRRGTAVIVALTGLVLVAGCGPAPETATETATEVSSTRGEVLYEEHCEACHGGATGGDIADIPPPHNAEGHTWHHADCELIDITLQGPPPRLDHPDDVPEMPAFENELTEEDVEAILAHIRTWWTEEQRESQAEVTEQVC